MIKENLLDRSLNHRLSIGRIEATLGNGNSDNASLRLKKLDQRDGRGEEGKDRNEKRV